MSGLTTHGATPNLRILYLGLPLGALCLADAGHRIVVCGLSHVAMAGARRVRRMLGRDGALLLGAPDLDDRSVQHLVSSARCDVLLSWFWMRRVPSEVLAMVPRGAFGVHPSLLPRWRGPDPYFWAIREGDSETGVTLHRLAPEYDTGPVVEQIRATIAPTQNAWQLARRLDRPSLQLLRVCADRLAKGESLGGTPQDETRATEAPAPSEEDLVLDWNRPTRELERLVRAAAPQPGATAQLENEIVEVLEARVVDETPPRALHVAEAWRTKHGLAVRTADGGLVLLRIRIHDRELGAEEIVRAFSNGG